MSLLVTNTNLPVSIEPPRIQFTSICQCNGVTITSRASLNLCWLRELNLLRSTYFSIAAKTKLAHLCLAPTVHLALVCYSKRIEATSSDLSDELPVE
jgi:hypothetical protein